MTDMMENGPDLTRPAAEVAVVAHSVGASVVAAFKGIESYNDSDAFDAAINQELELIGRKVVDIDAPAPAELSPDQIRTLKLHELLGWESLIPATIKPGLRYSLADRMLSQEDKLINIGKRPPRPMRPSYYDMSADEAKKAIAEEQDFYRHLLRTKRQR